MPEVKLLTVGEAAAILRVHRQTLYTWLRLGKLPSVNFCGRVRIDRGQLQAFLEAEAVRKHSSLFPRLQK